MPSIADAERRVRREVSGHAQRPAARGGTSELLAPFGLDAGDPAFWEPGARAWSSGFIERAGGTGHEPRSWLTRTASAAVVKRYAQRLHRGRRAGGPNYAGRQKYLGIASSNKSRHAQRAEGGCCRRHQGAADEGGADPRHHPRRACRRNMSEELTPACRPTHPRWAGPSCKSADGGRSWGQGWQARFAELRRARPRGRPHWARCMSAIAP